MALSQHKSKRSPTGARYHAHRKKTKAETGSLPTLTRVGEEKLKITKARGGSEKFKLLTAGVANLLVDAKKKTFVKAKITAVADNPANRHYTRRNIITKGTVITTEKGKAKVTSRPGQDGIVNAVLIKE